MRLVFFILDLLLIGFVALSLWSAYQKGKKDAEKKGGEKDVK